MDIKTITEGFGAVRELIELITKLGEETNNLTLQKAILELDFTLLLFSFSTIQHLFFII